MLPILPHGAGAITQVQTRLFCQCGASSAWGNKELASAEVGGAQLAAGERRELKLGSK